MSERAIDKMVKELEKRTEGHCEAWGAVLSLARRLALEEAKEKPKCKHYGPYSRVGDNQAVCKNKGIPCPDN